LLHTAGARKTVQTLNFELQAVPVSYKLTYFDAPGLAETTRLCFAATGAPFEDIRLPNSEAFQVHLCDLPTVFPTRRVSDRIFPGNRKAVSYGNCTHP
jgi:hypothetical protein